jgi:hypothetical protein
MARAMDMHIMVGQSPHDLHQTAEQVIEEIDEIMQGSAFTNATGHSDHTMESVDSLYSSLKSPLAFLNGGLGVMQRDPDLDAKLKEAAALTANRESRLQFQLVLKLIFDAF